ncbi:MAG: tRNA 4-thiouridine(8) synthase ThiI [Nanoarchaeota archaeon]|nr:tRNA 4-thiouridine(8) synthase ThiI [Nanoarchaeota archaeon]
MTILVRYGEIALKGPRVRASMENVLIRNLKAVLPATATFRKEPGRIFIENVDDLTPVTKTFGVVSASIVQKISNEYATIEQTVLASAKELKGTFAVRSRRMKSYPLTSQELDKQLGAAVVKNTNLTVNLSKPDTTIHIEVRDKNAYVFTNIAPGVGGLPAGTQGKVLMLFSGGFDSPVAAWRLAKRGCELTFLFYNPIGPALTEDVVAVYRELITKWHFPNTKLLMVDGQDITKHIEKTVPDRLKQVVFKRALYRIAEAVANQEHCVAIGTGESLGQVSTQTMTNLAVIEEAITLPVHRPLLAFDKTEIIHAAREIGTHDASEKVKEFCNITQQHATDKATLEEVRVVEPAFSFDTIQTMPLSATLPAQDYRPKSLTGMEIIPIAAAKYDLAPYLKKGKQYCIVCPIGVESKHVAARWRTLGFDVYACSQKEYEKLKAPSQ